VPKGTEEVNMKAFKAGMEAAREMTVQQAQ
jgi:Pyruvate/2-oxoacid:ferredoxin oxidoreductase gamma subunit